MVTIKQKVPLLPYLDKEKAQTLLHASNEESALISKLRKSLDDKSKELKQLTKELDRLMQTGTTGHGPLTELVEKVNKIIEKVNKIIKSMKNDRATLTEIVCKVVERAPEWKKTVPPDNVEEIRTLLHFWKTYYDHPDSSWRQAQLFMKAGELAKARHEKPISSYFMAAIMAEQAWKTYSHAYGERPSDALLAKLREVVEFLDNVYKELGDSDVYKELGYSEREASTAAKKTMLGIDDISRLWEIMRSQQSLPQTRQRIEDAKQHTLWPFDEKRKRKQKFETGYI